MTTTDFADQLNAWGANRIPFFFVVDFEMKKPLAFKLDEINPANVRYFINGITNYAQLSNGSADSMLRKLPEPFNLYRQRFEKVYSRLNYGDTFLTNLTIKTRIESDSSLKELFSGCRSKYKLWFNEQFLVFSPETFIQIRNSKIYAYPMKGTIDARLPGAAEIILHDRKEQAEHVTIVDLIRNDLSQVASHVKVVRFRYLEELRTNQKNLLQVSSEVVGDLPSDYLEHLGDILITLLPAGSVSGAPKPRTLQVIQEAEQEDRGYYTGVFGYFDGQSLDSAVMIRYIERSGDHYYYRSGGGITTQSLAEIEYQEAIDKIYVPID
jgi:para-aminobenzoate synthetase component I